MRGLENFKVPNFKFPKLKMEGIKEEIKAEPILPKKQIKYEPYDFKTIKEVFENDKYQMVLINSKYEMATDELKI